MVARSFILIDRRAAQRGFTLIELSIVLIIIGLVTGSILVGRDLVHAAELRADLSAVEQFTQGVTTFRGKYNCIPGDCANATDFFGNAAYNGNGNGIIEGNPAWDASVGIFLGVERGYAVDHLARASLIKQAPFDANNTALSLPTVLPKLPSSPVGRFILIQECLYHFPDCVGAARHTYRLGVNDGLLDGVPGGSVGTDIPIYTGRDAQYIDAKIDDGKAMSGIVTAGFSDSADSSVFLPIVGFQYVGGVCTSFASNGLTPACEYDLTTLNKQTGIFIRAPF